MKIRTFLSAFNLSCLKRAFFAFIFYLLGVGLLALISYWLSISYETIGKASYILTVLSVMLAAVFNSIKAERNGWLNGLSCGIVLVILLFFFSYITSGTVNITAFLLNLPIFLVISVISGIVAINLK